MTLHRVLQFIISASFTRSNSECIQNTGSLSSSIQDSNSLSYPRQMYEILIYILPL